MHADPSYFDVRCLYTPCSAGDTRRLHRFCIVTLDVVLLYALFLSAEAEPWSDPLLNHRFKPIVVMTKCDFHRYMFEGHCADWWRDHSTIPCVTVSLQSRLQRDSGSMSYNDQAFLADGLLAWRTLKIWGNKRWMRLAIGGMVICNAGMCSTLRVYPRL
jgi:hypothetical protein